MDLTVQDKSKLKLSDLSDFILQDRIGSGSFGKVYRAKEKQSNEIYAAKISLNEIDESTKDLFMNILQEVNIISKLNHPCVIKFIFYSPFNFKKKPKPVIITEYASNGSLMQLIEHDRTYPDNCILNDTLKLIIIYGIVSAMSYIHSHDILHRDLKPDNVLLDEFLFPKIADFGLSKSEISMNNSLMIKSRVGTIKGTPMFMAPEILSKSLYSKSSDVYAFSILVFEILTCQKPFSDIDIFSLSLKVLEGDRPEFNVFVPEVYKDLIIRCWSKDPSKRPTFDQIMIELRTNHNYITENVNENEFMSYIKFIDEYKTTFDSNKVVIRSSNFKKFFSKNEKEMKIRENINKDDEKLMKVIEYFDDSPKNHFPYNYFNALCEESQKIVTSAENGCFEKQFEIGRNLIEGRFDFPIDIKKGIDFLKESMNNGNIDSFKYYIKMLIKGEFIPENHKKVRKLLKSKLNENGDNESLCLFLEGKLYKNEKQYLKAAECFKKSMKNFNNIDSYYEYAELLRKNLYKPEFEDENFVDYYKEAIEYGNLQAMYKYGIYIKNRCQNEKEMIEGLNLIKQAADRGNLKAKYYYGTMPEQEENKSNDNENQNERTKNLNPMLTESMKYLKQSADEGHIESMNKYGLKLLKILRNMPKEENKEDAIRYMKKASAKGCFESMYEYGIIIVNGDVGIKSNPKEGAKYVKIAAENGLADAMGKYATLLKEGNGVEINYEEAVKYYEAAINKGSAVAMNDYGYMLKQGQGVEVNFKEAIKYFKMAIEKGFPNAMNNYALMLQYGQGIKPDYNEAIKYFKLAIDKGFPNSMNNYALMLKNGQGVEVNYEEAIKYFKMAIDKGLPNAMNNYALMLQQGKGVEVDYNEAIKYFKMAIEKGFPNAMNNYALMLQYGQGIKLDYNEAIKYYKMAIDKGYAISMNNYALMLKNGQGVEVNYKEAIKYFNMAIDKGYAISMNNYALMLKNGQGVDVNYKEAIKYFNMAIDRGNSNAMRNYALMLQNGQGVDVNYEEAIKYYKLAIKKNDFIAMLQYGLLLCKLKENETSIKEGLLYIKKSADNGNTQAMYEYGKVLEEGKLITINLKESIEYYKKAAEKGNVKAQNAIQNMNNITE